MSFPHLALICIYVERLPLELQLGHLVPVGHGERQQVHEQEQKKKKKKSKESFKYS